MKPIANQENLTAKLHRYEGAALCEEIRLPITSSPQACEAHSIPVTATLTKLTLPTYAVRQRSQLPPLFDGDNVYPFSIYPFDSALENNPVPSLVDYQSVELNNGLIKVTVLPSLGGRIYQIEDVRTGGLYLHENRCVRPTRVPPRWNFISLGIEHNFPYAHSPTGNEPVGCELLSRDDGAAGVAMGCREPQWGLSWRCEVWLHPGFRGVVVSTRCWNDTDTARKVQWWSNCAQPGGSDTEFVYPQEPYEAHIDGQGNGIWPMFHGIDLRWHRNYDRMVGVFLKPTATDWFGIYHHLRDWGLLHLADPAKLPGKKLWSFGNSGPTADWSLTMTRDGDQNVEIQAGVPELQSESLDLAPGGDFSFEEMWIPMDDRSDFEDGKRPVFASIAAEIGGIAAPPRKLPAGQPVSVWEDLIVAFQTAQSDFLLVERNHAGASWPPASLALGEPLAWAAASGDETWMVARAVWLAACDRWDEALQALADVIDRHPDSFSAHALMGLLKWKKQADPVAGRHFLFRALDLNFENSTACHLDALLKEQGDLASRQSLLGRWALKEDYRFNEIFAELLLDSGDARGCLKFLESRTWSRHHCRHRRTKMWVAARAVLGLATEPVPASLGEDPYLVGR